MLNTASFRAFLDKHDLYAQGDKVLLAVSGGKDSVLMAYLFNAIGADFGIAHCNFQLRGIESDGDEEFVKNLASYFHVPFYTESFDTKAVAESGGVSIQMAARELRYAWLEQLRSANHYQTIGVAHHLNDSVETVLLNLVRGTGISGLHGIIPKRQNIIRPLLYLDAHQIASIVEKEKIDYREDSSNSSGKYARNKIRLEVVPKLKEINPQLEETFLNNSRRFSELEAFITKQIAIIRDNLFELQPSGDVYVDLKGLKESHSSQSVLFELFKPFGFQENVLDDLIKSWNGIPGKTFESPTHTLLLDRQRLIIKKRLPARLEEVAVAANENSIHWSGITITQKSGDAQNIDFEKNSKSAYLDASLLQFPLTIRGWSQGDAFYPLGMNGKKKLSDYFINKKVPLTQKNSIPVLVNGNGDILWIAGFQSDNRYKVTPQTEKVIIFELQT